MPMAELLPRRTERLLLRLAQLDPRNAASARLCDRLGMRREAYFREDMWFEGEWGDTAVYALLAAEWRAAG
jgi:RimJ/RimL family protein N-acetyltransferase